MLADSVSTLTAQAGPGEDRQWLGAIAAAQSLRFMDSYLLTRKTETCQAMEEPGRAHQVAEDVAREGLPQL